MSKKPNAPIREILEANITRIALCKRGKNRLRTLYKSDDASTLELDTLVKATDTEAGELLAVVYAPNLTDTDGDVMRSREAIKKAAHTFNRDHRNLEIFHGGEVIAKERAYVAENFIIAKGDERFQNWKTYENEPVDLEGAWAQVIKLEDPVLRAGFRSGELDGVSMFGEASVRALKSEEHQDPARGKEQKMDLKEQEALAGTIAKAVVEGMNAAQDAREAKAAAAALAKAEADAKIAPVKKAEEAPIFKGDMNDRVARETFLGELRGYELRKAIEGGKSADEVAELFKALETEEPSDEKAGIKKGDTVEVRRLKLQLFKAQGRSKQVAKTEEVSTELSDLEKADEEAIKNGKEIADAVNASRGIVAPKV